MVSYSDGPASPRFRPVAFEGTCSFSDLAASPHVSAELAHAVRYAQSGSCVCWGMPFEIGRPVFIHDTATTIAVDPINAKWIVFLHTSDGRYQASDRNGFTSPMRGVGQLGEHAADYVFIYEDGTEHRAGIRRRHQVGSCHPRWGELCTEAVTSVKPRSLPFDAQLQAVDDSIGSRYPISWGVRQQRVIFEEGLWNNFLWAFENPCADKAVVSIRFEPINGGLVISGICAGNVGSTPLRWNPREKMTLTVPDGFGLTSMSDDNALIDQIRLDLGQVISAGRRLLYPMDDWEASRPNQEPCAHTDEIVVEYAAHEEACFHLRGGQQIPVVLARSPSLFSELNPSRRRVTLRVVEAGGTKVVPVKLHVHGSAGEYLSPLNRMRTPNPGWFENYSPDFVLGDHISTYISGDTVIDLPLGEVFIEITKGFEIRPLRKVVTVTAESTVITLEIEKTLRWRDKGWVTADTHVHFLSPGTAMLEGAAEGVNVINLLAAQWGEMMTNVGDFDSSTTFGTSAAGGAGEFLVRVGTENRQHVLGHISLLGYSGNMITPLSTGGADESAIGDPVGVLLTEWAQQCRVQGGIAVLPHFPDPRMENAATIVLGEADAVEFCSRGRFFDGLDSYSLSDWYRYLNNGYLVPAVGGTDKMSARYAVGTVRTYAKISDRRRFDYESWMDAIRAGHTFVTHGPLVDFAVDGKPMGSRLQLPPAGGTVDITWNVASVMQPMTKVELVVNGEVTESQTVRPNQDAGHWSFSTSRSCWVAVLVRAKYADKPEIIAAHTSPVMIGVDGSHLFNPTDAVTILEQIEGASAYINTLGTRAETRRLKEMLLILNGAYRRLHDRMHQMGFDHPHFGHMSNSGHDHENG